MSKIIICGLNGAGKTSLGKIVSAKTDYIHKDIEDYYFSCDNDYKYNKSKDRQTVIKLLEEDFEKYQNIILTTCKGNYGCIDKKCNLAIYLKVPKKERIKRVKERSYKQFKERVLPNGDLYQQEKKFWSYVMKRNEEEIANWFESLSCEKLVLDGTKPLEENAILITQIIQTKKKVGVYYE